MIISHFYKVKRRKKTLKGNNCAIVKIIVIDETKDDLHTATIHHKGNKRKPFLIFHAA